MLNPKNKGAKVFSARLAKVLLLITSLTTGLCKAREHVAKSGEIKQRKTKITAEVQGTYPNCQQKTPEEENFVISKLSESQPLFVKCRPEQQGSKS